VFGLASQHASDLTGARASGLRWVEFHANSGTDSSGAAEGAPGSGAPAVGTVLEAAPPGPGPMPSGPAAVPLAAAPGTAPPAAFPCTCQHCGCHSSLHPVRVPSIARDRAVRFAIKCFGVDDGEECGRVRVFSYLEPPGAPPDLSEVPPLQPSYPFIQAMVEYGARSPRGRMGNFLLAACDLHMVGLLESDPKSREAAYAGSAINLRKAAELLTYRFIFHKPVRPGKRNPDGLRTLATKLATCASPPGLIHGAKQPLLSRRLLFIIDIGDVAAHPDVTRGDLHKRKWRRLADDKTIRKAFSYFESVIGKVDWQ
jgi:hypothetical protein